MSNCMSKEIFFQKLKFNYKATKYQVHLCSRVSTDNFISVLFLDEVKFIIVWLKISAEQFMIKYFNILAFVISLSNLNFFYLNNNQL